MAALRIQIGETLLPDLSVERLTQHLQARQKAGAGGMTIAVDLTYLGSVLKAAKNLWRLPVRLMLRVCPGGPTFGPTRHRGDRIEFLSTNEQRLLEVNVGKNELNKEIEDEVSQIIGRDISGEAAGDVHSFSDFSQSDIDEFRILGNERGVLAVKYIKWRLVEGVPLYLISSFYELVVEGGMPIETWCDSN